MTFAGVAQHRERRVSNPEVAGANPAPRSIVLQAMAKALQINDARAFEAGRIDGAAGSWRLSVKATLAGNDAAYSYACGFNHGLRFGRLRKGD